MEDQAVSPASSGITQAPRPSSLADVLDLILDKGLVIDAYVRVSLVGIEILTVDARIVVASVDTYLRFAEAVNRLDLRATETEGLPGMMGHQRDGRGRELSQGEGGNGSGNRQQSRSRQRSGNRQEAKSRGRGQEEGGGEESLVGRLAGRGRWRED
jgi:hypothetical protein